MHTSIPRRSRYLTAFLLCLLVCTVACQQETRRPMVLTPGPSPILGSGVAAAMTPLFDDFSDPTTGTVLAGADEVAQYRFVDGTYQIAIQAAETLAWGLIDHDYGDMTVEVDTWIEDDTVLTATGLIFGYQNDRNFYLFRVASNGFYSLERLEENAWTVLLDWTPAPILESPATLPDGSLSYRLRVTTRGQRISLLVNGHMLEETIDHAFPGGKVALAASTLNDRTIRIRFDNLSIRPRTTHPTTHGDQTDER
ncbi:MAG: hypothetical protein HC837_11180 [Chloroflexaceae bacterium]|nr:hypothetical protein [Chloroflexaceae bacterium]